MTVWQYTISFAALVFVILWAGPVKVATEGAALLTGLIGQPVPPGQVEIVMAILIGWGFVTVIFGWACRLFGFIKKHDKFMS